MSFEGPTISAPSSPSVFHSHARTYHASRRTSASPRFLGQVSSAASRRNDAPPPPTSAGLSQSPVPSYRRSPQPRRREQTATAYVNAGTQYSPEGYPPTYHPRPPPAATAVDTAERTQALAELVVAHPERREFSAESVVTEPPAPSLAAVPQPVVPVRHAQSTTPMSVAAERPAGLPAGQPDVQRNEASLVSPAEVSPSKRLRPQDPEPKIMPLKYETCDVKDLGVLISDMLMELVRLNDGFPLRDGQLTRFHSRAPPAISVKDYLFRLIVHATLSPPILLSMVFYVDKLCTMYPAFTISSLTVHRFLITAATVAAKGLSDSFWTNGLYAKVGGVSIRELALLELEFLRRLEWRIVPKPETLVDYYKGLVERGAGYVLEREQALDLSLPSVPDDQAKMPVPDVADATSA